MTTIINFCHCADSREQSPAPTAPLVAAAVKESPPPLSSEPPSEPDVPPSPQPVEQPPPLPEERQPEGE